LDHLWGNRTGCALIQRLQDFHGAGGLGFVPVNLELFVSVRDLDV
jgi:hypothetical protein